MGMHALDLNSAKVSSGTKGVYLEAGNHELEVTDWKVIETRKKGDAFIVDFKILDSTTHDPGTVRNVYISASGPAGDMAAEKIKRLLIALSGLHPVADAGKIASEDWNKLFKASLAKPQLLIGKRVRCNATKQLKAGSKALAQQNPSLLEQPGFAATAYYLDLHFTPWTQQKAANDNAQP
jgi:hypothetical protein